MIEYLFNHFRYDTMNSWNQSTSYARKVKLCNLTWESEKIENNAYEMLEQREAYYDVEYWLDDFADRYNHNYQIWFNGRSGGYLVLGQGGKNKDNNIYTQPGKSLDMNEDFEDWSIDELKDRVNLVWDFDKTVEKAIKSFQDFAKNYHVEEKEIEVTKTIKIAVEN